MTMAAFDIQPDNKELAHKWISQISGLVSPPDICIKVFELIEANAPLADIGDIISQDPNLAVRLLKIVNSPYYSFASRIDTISRATSVIGIRELSSLLISISAVKTFSTIPIDLVNIDTFWRHSIYTGLIARQLAQECHILHPERLFVAGLLHDIGSLVIYSQAPEESKEILTKAAGNEQSVFNNEIETFGFSHSYIGGILLEAWKIPETLRESIAFHHEPELATDATREASILHIAEALANRSEIGAFCEQADIEIQIEPYAWETIKLKEADLDLDDLIGNAGLQFAEMAQVLSA